ncbi:hypothetical protein GCM10022403_065590 [Streptomyces coacervatus]|uniref:DUF916 domain-containing protein n=1 Tax=Streptomyces coacervatus TaxID=647381 RepID=A0ABP7INM1_9ACTN
MTVPPHGRVAVPCTLHVPQGAEPGDHPGALVALDERIDKGDGSLALGVQRAVAARVYLRVGGPTLPAIAVENVHVVHHQPLVPGLGDSTATISYTLHNTGNVTLTASATGTRESASASFFALPWVVTLMLLAAVVVGVVLGVRARRGRALPSVPVRPSRPAAPTPSRPRSSPSARP